MTTTARRAIIYVRLSEDREGAGLAVDRQEQDCRQLAASLGWPIVAVRSDNDISASTGKPRPDYDALLEDLEAGRGNAVLAWHTDRVHRTPVELEHYIDVCEPRNIPTVTVKAGALDLTTPSGRMVARLLGATARYEIEHKVERQQRARLQAAGEGRWSGGRRPYGYQADGVTVIEAEAAIIRWASEQVLAGRSLRSIAKELNARAENLAEDQLKTSGLRTSTGGPWRQDTVRDVLLRGRNAGLMVHNGKVVGPAGWQRLVDEDTWRAVVAVLTDPARRTNPGAPPRWLLSGLARCGVCGSPVRSSRGRQTVPTYVCATGKHVIRNAVEADKFIVDVIAERLSRPDAADLLVRDSRVDLPALHARKVALRSRLDGLAEAYADGAIDAPQLRSGSDRLHAQLAEVDTAIGEASRGSALKGVADAPDPVAAWRALTDLDRRRAIVDELMTVEILPAPKGRRPGWKPGEPYFDPTTIRVTPKRG
jgi:site-specific DNA recombinase